MEFRYTAVNRQGQSESGSCSARDKAHALAVLRQRGFHKIEKLAPSDGAGDSFLGRIFQAQPSSWDFYVFFRQLAAFVKSGESLPLALADMEKQQPNAQLRTAMKVTRSHLEKGESCADALEKAKIFPPFAVHIIRAGESGGGLADALWEIGIYLKQTGEIEKARNAALLPIKLILAAMALCIVAIVFELVPKYKRLYEDLDIPLPPITKALFIMSDTLQYHWYIMIVGVIVLSFLWKRFKVDMKPSYDRLLLNLPLYNKVYRNLLMYRFTKTMELLLPAGISIVDSLLLTADVMNNTAATNTLIKARDRVGQGYSVASSIRENDSSRVFDYIILNFLATGQATGGTNDILRDASVFYREMVEMTTERFSKMIGPIFLLPVAGSVLFIMLAVYMPLFKAMEGLK